MAEHRRSCVKCGAAKLYVEHRRKILQPVPCVAGRHKFIWTQSDREAFGALTKEAVPAP